MVQRKEYLDQLISWKEEQVIKVVTGILRCGKSTLLLQFQQWLKENGIIKNTDTVELHICGHCISMAPVRDISLDDHAVITGNDAVNFISVFIRK